MSKPKVLLLGTVDHAQPAFDSLSEIATIVTPKSSSRQDFIQECSTPHLNDVLAVYRTFQSSSITGLWDDELVNALPKTLKFCSHVGAGYDQIDVHACSARDPPIHVSNVPTAVDDATADTAMFLLLGALKGFNSGIFALRQKQWRGSPAPPLGHDPRGKVLGILGMGGIGRNMKVKAEAFGMKVIYHNRKPVSEEMAGGAKYVGFDGLLAQSDVLSLNLPLNKNTRHIIDAQEFARMKTGVCIVNTARGAVMNEAALVEALESGKVASAGLDVFENEPEIHPGLIDKPQVLLLPHMGTYTKETLIKMEEWCIDNVRSAITTGRLKSPVPEQADL
ncbi:glyoxylate reductase [Oleoguttula sp. CCFEE 5521]